MGTCLNFESHVAAGKVRDEGERDRARSRHVLEAGEVILPVAAEDAIGPVVGHLEAVEGARAAALPLPRDAALQLKGEKLQPQEAIASASKNIRPRTVSCLVVISNKGLIGPLVATST